MKTVKGPGIFLSQFITTQPPFNSLAGLAEWAAGLGYRALQIPATSPLFSTLSRQRSARLTATRCGEHWPVSGWRSVSFQRIWKGNWLP